MAIRGLSPALRVVALVGLPLTGQAISHQVGDGPARTAAQIFEDAKQVTTRATDFHVLGSFNSSGFTEMFDLNVSPVGGGGTVEFSRVTVSMVLASGALYVKANARGWQVLGASEQKAGLMANKWIREPRASPEYSFAQFAESTQLVRTITSGISGLAELRGTTIVEGKRARVLTDSEHDKIYVASVGTPYLLRFQGGGDGSSGSISFSGFGHSSVPTAPAHWTNLPQ
ncbi:MAG: hypothetical protein ABSA91_16385 [Acidimicrobiales bacterium]